MNKKLRAEIYSTKVFAKLNLIEVGTTERFRIVQNKHKIIVSQLCYIHVENILILHRV